MNYLESLPNELLDEIFSYLPVKTLLELRITSRRFNAVLKSAEITNLITKKDGSISEKVRWSFQNNKTLNLHLTIKHYTFSEVYVPDNLRSMSISYFFENDDDSDEFYSFGFDFIDISPAMLVPLEYLCVSLPRVDPNIIAAISRISTITELEIETIIFPYRILKIQPLQSLALRKFTLKTVITDEMIETINNFRLLTHLTIHNMIKSIRTSFLSRHCLSHIVSPPLKTLNLYSIESTQLPNIDTIETLIINHCQIFNNGRSRIRYPFALKNLTVFISPYHPIRVLDLRPLSGSNIENITVFRDNFEEYKIRRGDKSTFTTVRLPRYLPQIKKIYLSCVETEPFKYPHLRKENISIIAPVYDDDE